MRVRRDDGPDFLTIVEAGGLARCGMNAAGIAITANYLESERDFSQTGVPLALIRRKVLEQEHFAFAIKAVATTPKSCSNNMMLSTVAGFGSASGDFLPRRSFRARSHSDSFAVSTPTGANLAGSAGATLWQRLQVEARDAVRFVSPTENCSPVRTRSV